MIVWQVIANEIGLNGDDAAYFATRAQALAAMREHRQYCKNKDRDRGYITHEPRKLTITTREKLAHCLNDATGYGASRERMSGRCEEARANAYVMAATPELLAALYEMYAALDNLMTIVAANPGQDIKAMLVAERARRISLTAIAKAEGRS
jgi:hypothetical protein